MERLILNQLLNWKNSPYRKPLILKGVRQVGKTWILKEFGRRFYENTAYFNFDENEEYNLRGFLHTSRHCGQELHQADRCRVYCMIGLRVNNASGLSGFRIHNYIVIVIHVRRNDVAQ